MEERKPAGGGQCVLGTALEPRPGRLVGAQGGVVCENFTSETAQAGFARAIYWRLSVRC